MSEDFLDYSKKCLGLFVVLMLGVVGIFALYAIKASTNGAVGNTPTYSNVIDGTITHFLNQFATRSQFFDSLMVEISNSGLLKGGVTITILLYLWFSCEDSGDPRRGTLMATLVLAAISVLATRGITHLLPFRTRPVFNADVHFVNPINFDPRLLITWSSFPSDHAALFFALATGIYIVSPRWGRVALLHAAIIVCFPRLYLGIHWATDLFTGALIGVAAGLAANITFLRNAVHQLTLRLNHYNRALFYAGFFLFCVQVMTLFDDVRHLAIFLARALGKG